MADVKNTDDSNADLKALLEGLKSTTAFLANANKFISNLEGKPEGGGLSGVQPSFPRREQTLEERVRDKIIESPWETHDLARDLKTSDQAVLEILKRFQEEDNVATCTGFDDSITWVWKLGPDAPIEKRRALLKEMMKLRFIGQREFKAAFGMKTKEQAKLLDGDVTDVRRHCDKRMLMVRMRGNDNMYLIPPDEADLGWLETPLEKRKRKAAETNQLEMPSATPPMMPKRRGRPPKQR